MLAACCLSFAGCASRCVQNYDRPFAFERDTFAYANDLVWEYQFDDATGKTSHRARQPRPDYTHHCFVVARSARQFFQHARFDAAAPATDDRTYRTLIRRVVSRDPMNCTAEQKRIVIPGFANLRDFSMVKEGLLKDECGGAWRSYFQRGHWRVMVPFTRRHQRREAERWLRSLHRHRPPVVHLTRFPQLTINHAIVVFDAKETADEIQFIAYDPFEPAQPTVLTFDRGTRVFRFPRNPYFIGGKVNAYEVYHAWNY